MPNFQRMLTQLRSERDRMQEQLRKLDHAIGAMEGVSGDARTGRRSRTGKRRKRSAAARARMAAAQRARWAKVKRAETSKPVRKMSRAARKKIAAAQRARWAKVKARQQAEQKVA